MGNLLKVLQCKEDAAYDDLYLDFENARPSESEMEVYTQVSHVLSFAPAIIKELEAYKGAGGPIREAIQNPSSEEKQKEAWDAIIPLVHQLKNFFEFSINLEKCLQELLRTLTSNDETPFRHLETKQALAKQFAEILQYTLKFDDLKMNNPAIQNDFSYFRRTMSRKTTTGSCQIDYNEGKFVSNELTNKMSLFYAEATPMLKTMSTATMKFVSENQDVETERTSELLCTMCNICKLMLNSVQSKERFTMGKDTIYFCVRVMVGLIILYDHIHPAGAFCKASGIDVKGAMKVIKDLLPEPVAKRLYNTLRYTTKHAMDENTPKAIKVGLQSFED